MKVAIKSKGELKYVDAENVLIRGKPIVQYLEHIQHLEDSLNNLIETLQGTTIVREGDTLSVNGQLMQARDVAVFETPKLPLPMLTVVDGKLVPDKRKVGII